MNESELVYRHGNGTPARRAAVDHQAAPLAEPDWVICGGRAPRKSPHRYRVLASKELSAADLEYRMTRQDLYDEMALFDPVASVITSHSYRLTCTLGRMVLIEADSYGACMEALFAKWSPDQPPPERHAALPPGGQ